MFRKYFARRSVHTVECTKIDKMINWLEVAGSTHGTVDWTQHDRDEALAIADYLKLAKNSIRQ